MVKIKLLRGEGEIISNQNIHPCILLLHSVLLEFFTTRERGFGGIYGVGAAAAHPPALVILSFNPKKPQVNK